MAFVVVEKGPSQDVGRLFTLGVGSTLIGRIAPGNEPSVVINDDYISRRHAVLDVSETDYKIMDLGSSNGTSVDGFLIKPGESAVLSNNSIIELAIISGLPRVSLRFKTTDKTLRAGDDLVSHMSINKSWLRIDQAKKQVWVDGKDAFLSKKEYRFLLLLYRKAGDVCSRDEIVAEVWPEVKDIEGVSESTIDQLIHRVRSKIELNPNKPRRILNRMTFGYILVTDE
jgi:DNA-binding winged helix-turn-helix (wHTH) protein